MDPRPLSSENPATSQIAPDQGQPKAKLVGVPLAALLAYSTAFERAIYPLIVGSNTVPKVALAPLLLAWFGFGMGPKILIVCW